MSSFENKEFWYKMYRYVAHVKIVCGDTRLQSFC